MNGNIVYARKYFKCAILFCFRYDGFSFTSKNQYSRYILAGLLVSMLGDVCLVYADEGYFLHGKTIC